MHTTTTHQSLKALNILSYNWQKIETRGLHA